MRKHPSKIKIGDHVPQCGFVIEVTDIKISEASLWNITGLPVYRFYGTYVSGDKNAFDYFDHDADGSVMIQDNELANWSVLN